MIHNLIITIITIDVFILIMLLTGLFFTIKSIKKNKGTLKSDSRLLAKYMVFILFSILSFVVEWSLFFHIHDDIITTIYGWILFKRMAHMAFTILAIVDHNHR